MSIASTLHSHSSGQPSSPGPAPPAPSFIFRGHDAPIHSLEFFASNTFLVTGDEEGWICVWDIWKRRQVYKWHGHPSASVLALKTIPILRTTVAAPLSLGPAPSSALRHNRRILNKEQVYIVSHGRDNEICVWDINDILEKSLGWIKDLSTHRGTASTTTPMGYPSASLEPLFRLPVNALNFCKMSILAIDASPPAEMSSPTAKQLHGTEKTLFSSLLSKTHQHIYVAVPSPTTATLIDVYDIVKPERTFAAVGAPQAAGMASATIEGGGENRKWGSVMAIQLFQQQGQSLDSSSIPLDTEAEVLPSQLEGVIARALSMLVGYEDGSVALFKESAFSSTATADEGKKYKRKMDTLWTIKCHRDSVLALNVSSDFQFAMSSGSDNVLVKYDLTSHLQGVPEVQQAVLKSNGIADIKIRNDNKVLGLAGWDGSLRVYSVKTLKPLAILKYHREGLYGLAFALIHQQPTSIEATAIQGGGAEHEQADREAEAKEKDHGSSDHESEDDTDEDDSSDLEDALEGRRQWSTRHWIATGGKENRISLWEIY